MYSKTLSSQNHTYTLLYDDDSQAAASLCLTTTRIHTPLFFQEVVPLLQVSPLWKGKGYFWSKPNLMKNMWNQQRSHASMSERKTEFISQWPEKQRFSKTTSVTFTLIDITKNMLLRIFIYSTCERNHLKSISTSIWNRIS